MPPKTKKTLKAPPLTAKLEEHKKHATEFLELEEYKQKPEGFPDEEHETEAPTNP